MIKIKLELNYGSARSMFKLYPGYRVYFMDNANTFAKSCAFDGVNLLNFEQSVQTYRSTRMVNPIKDLLFFLSVDCVEGSLYDVRQT